MRWTFIFHSVGALILDLFSVQWHLSKHVFFIALQEDVADQPRSERLSEDGLGLGGSLQTFKSSRSKWWHSTRCARWWRRLKALPSLLPASLKSKSWRWFLLTIVQPFSLLFFIFPLGDYFSLTNIFPHCYIHMFIIRSYNIYWPFISLYCMNKYSK